MKRILFSVLLLSSCTQRQKDNSKQAIDEIRKTDIAMSDMAGKEGFFKALLNYAEDSVIIPREGRLPFMNKTETEAAWANRPIIKEYSWKPVRATASSSGDMGFTFGFATYLGTDTTTYTNYCTIWRKQKDGTWKFVYDGGNNTPNPWNNK